MVQCLGAYQGECIFQRIRQLAVCLAGFRVARRMVMHQDYRRRVVREYQLHHLPWMDAGFFQSAAKQLMKAEHAVFAIE
ncbi:hypothetical protein D3C85_1650760 [compost metagenome]